MSIFKIIIQLQIFLSFISLIQSSQMENVYFLISAKLNGTSPAISLDTLKSNDAYVYFLFDFGYHNEHIKKSKNVAYFKISTSLNIPVGEELTRYSIAYRFSQKEWNQVKNNKVANNIMYKKIPKILKEEKKGIYNYYFKIEKSDDRKITLIIRVPTQGESKGFLNIYNILELPPIPKIKSLN